MSLERVGEGVLWGHRGRHGGRLGDAALATLWTPANQASNPAECALEYAHGLVPEHDRHADNRGYGRREGHHRIRSEVHHYTPPWSAGQKTGLK